SRKRQRRSEAEHEWYCLMDFEAFRQQLQTAINAGGLPETFHLKRLFGGEWPPLPEGVRAHDVGKWFKDHVPGHEGYKGVAPFDGIAFSHKTTNNRFFYRLAP